VVAVASAGLSHDRILMDLAAAADKVAKRSGGNQ
jgi:hypothetical protein